MTMPRVAHVGADLGAINLDDLHELYFVLTHAPAALIEFDRLERHGHDDVLPILLRHHRERAVTTQRELFLREAFDALLSYYGLLEIACLLGYVNTPDAATLATAHRVLATPAVRTFYRHHYPLLLPELFRRRAAGERDLVLAPADVHLAGFQRFLDLSATLRESPPVDHFLALLDDFVLRDGETTYARRDLLLVLREPAEVLRRLTLDPDEQTPLDSALHGFRIFLRFCQSFDELLRSLTAYPVQQSALWHHHAYWFDTLRDKLGDALREALAYVARSDPAALAESDDALPASVGRLLSGRYGWALRETNDLSGLLPPLATLEDPPGLVMPEVLGLNELPKLMLDYDAGTA